MTMKFPAFENFTLPTHQDPSPFVLSPTSSLPFSARTPPLISPTTEGMSQINQAQKLQAITQDQGPLKPAFKKKQTQGHPKRVHWDFQVIDNERKMLPRMNSGATRVPLNFAVAAIQPSKSSLLSLEYDHSIHEGTTRSPEIKTHSHRRYQAQTASTSARKKSLPPHMNHETTLEPCLEVESGSSRIQAKHSNEHRIPPRVPDAPQRSDRHHSPSSKSRRLRNLNHKLQDSPKPPPAPRPERLPSPDLPAIGHRPFCECCETQAHFYPRTEREYFGPEPQKWELQRVYCSGIFETRTDFPQ